MNHVTHLLCDCKVLFKPELNENSIFKEFTDKNKATNFKNILSWF